MKRKTTTKLRVGDRVYKQMGPHRALLEVVEDRGSLGIGGRQIVRLRYLGPHFDPDSTFELPAEYLTIARRAKTSARSRRSNGHTPRTTKRPAPKRLA